MRVEEKIVYANLDCLVRGNVKWFGLWNHKWFAFDTYYIRFHRNRLYNQRFYHSGNGEACSRSCSSCIAGTLFDQAHNLEVLKNKNETRYQLL